MRQSFSQYIDSMRESETARGHLGATLDSPALGGSAEVVATREAGQPGYEVPLRAINEPGFAAAGTYRPRNYDTLYSEAQRLVERALTGDRWGMLRLQEAMTTSDFPLLFGDVLDRDVLANYAETPYTWDMYCARKVLNDLRLARMFRVDRGAAVLDGPIVPNSYGATGAGPTGLQQVTEYPMRRRQVTGYTDQLYKFGCRMDFSFETIINDDLDALKDTPALLGRAARRTEEARATKLFTTSSGPNTSFYNAANKNIISSAVIPGYTGLANPPFSMDALKWALVVVANQRDLVGEPISIEAATLVYPPALMVDVKNVLNAKEAWVNIEGGNIATYGSGGTQMGASAIRLNVLNWALGLVREAMNYYLPVVNTTSGHTAWYLFASPSKGRPALQQSFLRGREAPQLLMRLPNQVAVGQGQMGPGQGVIPGTANTNPMEGDFETDGIDYKLRHFLGGTPLDPIMSVASTGLGS